MPRLIIGHVDDHSARIWIRGTADHPVGALRVLKAGGRTVFDGSLQLEQRHFYTGVLEVDGLEPGTEYTCEVDFGPDEEAPPEAWTSFPDTSGRFHTFPAPGEEAPLSFLFGSCNLHSLGLFQPPGPAFERLGELAREKECDLMIHCGDQIYADLPFRDRAPDLEHYRDKYLDAWDDCKPARRLLTQLPHYMILDDHEIQNNFRNDMELEKGSVELLKAVSLKAYRAFQHIHNPQTYGSAPLYYAFSFGAVQIFVLDLRTERYAEDPGKQMIDAQQMERFKAWLTRHKDAPKLVVTSVPFVGEVRNTDDKWCSEAYRPQKHEILEHLLEERIERLCFLTGDMHNSYHAELELTEGETTLTLHELMSSPINQLGKNSPGRYHMGNTHDLDGGGSYRATFPTTDGGEPEFYHGHSNAMHVRLGGDTVSWAVYRTKRHREAEITGTFTL